MPLVIVKGILDAVATAVLFGDIADMEGHVTRSAEFLAPMQLKASLATEWRLPVCHSQSSRCC